MSISLSKNETEEFHSPHKGMPPLDLDGPAISFFEFWPTKLFYIPIALECLALSAWYRGATLPTISNPHFPMGGWVGESKEDVLTNVNELARQYIAPFISFTARPEETAEAECNRALNELHQSKLDLPIVAKPNVGCRGVGVRPIRTRDDLIRYFEAYPRGEKLLLQKLIDYEAEAGVFYIRLPEEEQGRIFSITLKYFPHVVGDGQRNLKQLIEEDWRAGQLKHIYLERHKNQWDRVLANGEPFRIAFTGSHSRGTIFRDGCHLITPEMTQAFDDIAKSIPDFYFGRFDVRFPDITDLQQGRNFHILEINGAGGEATHIWDRKTPLWKAYLTLFRQFQLLYKVGYQNRNRGFKPASLRSLYNAWQEEKRLTALYPYTE